MLLDFRRVLFRSICMISLWIASSWISQINTVWVALAGCVLLMLPGINIINTKEFISEINPESIILIGTVLSIGKIFAMQNVPIIQSLVVRNDYSLFLCIMIIAAITFIGLCILPIAPSLVTFLIPILLGMFQQQVNPVIIIIIVSLCAQNCYLFPIDTVCLISYRKVYYKMTDLIKPASMMQV